MKSKSKVSDVAQRAGVSVATVSRAFNLPKLVREDVRKRVMAAARDLGYSPNAAAKALRMQRTHIVGAVFPTLNYDIFARMINAFQSRLSEAGYMVFLLTVGFDNRDIYEPVRLLVDRGAEALLIVGRIDDDRLKDFLLERRLPVVTTYSYQSDKIMPSIGFDNYAASLRLIEYLMQLGHRHITMICGPRAGNDRQQARVRAYQDAMAKADLRRSVHVVEKSHTLTDGAAAMRAIHSEHPETTAVVCNSDILAFGALAECRKLGLRVPDHLSITGFDDQDIAALTDPPLTTVAVPAQEMGIRSAEALLHAMTSERKIASVRLDTNLIVRASSAPPRS